MPIDVAAVRKEFPTLQREVRGERLVYLDSAATSQTPEVVLDAMERYYRTFRSNVHRGVYLLAEEATDAYEGARTALARLVGADPRGVVFTKNATEACNLVAYGYVRRTLGPGDALLCTVMEHHANMVPFVHAANDRGFEVRYVPVTEDGHLDLEEAARLVADGRVRFAAFTHVSNTLGDDQRRAPARRHRARCEPPTPSSTSTGPRRSRTCRSTSRPWAWTATR